MRPLIAGLLTLLVSLTPSPGRARRNCADEVQVAQVRGAIFAACGCPDADPQQFRRCMHGTVKALRTTPKVCRREALVQSSASVCGRPDTAVVCCVRTKRGRSVSAIRTETKCRSTRKRTATTCPQQSREAVLDVAASVEGAFLAGVADLCTPDGTCVTTTTTPTSPPPTIPTTLCSGVGTLDFTTAAPAGDCGETRAGTGTLLKALGCGGLNIGGPQSTVAEGPTPDGATSRFQVCSCAGTVCRLGPEYTATPDHDCTAVGCRFGTPLPIRNGGTSTCVLNLFAAEAAGTLDVGTGVTTDLSVNLASNTYLTGDGAVYPNGPCPVCATKVGEDYNPVSGSIASPATGVCDGGPSKDAACTSTNSQGLTNDCTPPPSVDCDENGSCPDGSLFLAALPVDLTPLATNAVTRTASDGIFCDGQFNAGCFFDENSTVTTTDCRTITETGSPFGDLTAGTGTGVLASVFCIPATGNGLIDLAANLPGPGALSLPGTLRYTPAP